MSSTQRPQRQDQEHTSMADKSKPRVGGVLSMVWMSARVKALIGPMLHIMVACPR